MKSFAKFAVLGVSSIVLFKLLTTVFIPMLALVLGLLGLTVKLALFAAVIFFLYSIFRKPRRDRDVEVG